MAEAQDNKSSDNTIFSNPQNEVHDDHTLVYIKDISMYSEFVCCFSRYEKTIEISTTLAQQGCILTVLRVTVEPELSRYVRYSSLFCRIAKKWIASNFTG
jgi:hypothetical protein